MALDPRADAIILEESFYKALRRWGGGGFSGGGSGGGGAFGGSRPSNTSTNAAPSAGSGAIGAIADTLKGSFSFLKSEVTEGAKATGGALVGLTEKLINGGVKVSDVTTILSQEFTRAGNAGSVLGKTVGTTSEILGGMAKYVEEGVDAFRDLSKSGANFNNDVIELRNSAANTRMTLGEFQDVVKNNSKGLAGLDSTVGRGAKVFTELSKSFFDSRAGDNLRLLGYTSKDVNELMMVQLAGMSKRELAEAGGQRAALERLERMGKEMDSVSKLTGARRDELEKELRKNREDAQRRAAIESFILEGGKNARAAMDMASTQFSKAGPSFAKAASEIVTAGRALGPETAAITGTMSGEVQQALAEARQAVKEGREEDARAASERAATLYAAQSATKTNLDLAAQGVDVFKSKMEAIDFGKKLNETADQFRKQGMSEAQAIAAANELLKKEVKANQDAQSGSTETAILLEARLQDTSAALNNSLIVPLNGAVNKSLLDFAGQLKKVQGPDAKYQQSGYLDPKQQFPTGFRGMVETEGKGLVDKAVKEAQGAAAGAVGNRPFQQQAPVPEFKDSKLEERNRELIAALRDPRGGQAKDLPVAKEILGALNAKDREAITAKIDALAKQNQQTGPELIRSLLDKGELSKLKAELMRDPSTSQAMQRSEEARQRRDRGSLYERETQGSGRTPGGAGPFREAMGGFTSIEGLFDTIPGKVEVINPVKIEGVGKEATGSKDVFGDWFKGPKNRLSLIGENEEEATVPKSKIQEFLNDVLGTMPSAPGLNLNGLIDSAKVSLSSSNTPGIDASSLQSMGASLRSAAATIPGAVNMPTNISNEVQSSSLTAKQAADAKTLEDSAQNATIGGGQKATLDDVVKELERLNMKIATLTEETMTIGSKQERATRSNNQNLYQR